jgi:hypothetical protein
LNIEIAEPENTKWTIIRIERGGGAGPEASEKPSALGTDWQRFLFQWLNLPVEVDAVTADGSVKPRVQ